MSAVPSQAALGSVQKAEATAPVAAYASSDEASDDAARLGKLWRTRSDQQRLTDYPIGPGDVIEISVPAMEELRQRSVRVSADGTLALPLIGVVQAGGLTEEQLREALIQRLRVYMYQPQVDVFVKEYRSRQVAVVGAVKQPGLVTLKSPSQTILDVISEAGGITPQAADQIVLFPTEDQSSGDGAARAGGAHALGGSVRQASIPQHSADAMLAPGLGGSKGELADYMTRGVSGRHPLIISLRSTAFTGAGRYLHMPVRPGDVIVIPGGGDVMVIGWVNNPGHFQVGSGLSVLGAIGAAGGPMYPADTSDVHLIRTKANGEKSVIHVDVSRILAGQASDIPVQSNDVIDVPYSNVKIGPYVLYSVVSKVGYGFGWGMSIP